MTKTATKKKEDTMNLDAILFKCRDILRQAKNSGSFFEKRDMMLTLVFLRFIGEKYEDGVAHLRAKLIEQGLDPDDENIIAAFFEDATFTDGTYDLPKEAQWSTIINTPAPGLNVALDTALRSIATNTPDLKGCFVEGTFTQRNLGANDIKRVVDEVNKISHKAFGAEKDLIGRVYEYFLKEFAVNATKEEGEFYTPHDIVQLIATIIEPFDGTLYDPCCGSGGMFIQSAELVKSKQGDISQINVYGQEKEAATYRLAKMNLALRGISHNLGPESDSTFTNDLHKGIYFDYIMANPPFNLKGWYNDNLKNDARWSDYETPPESNANYAWILHIVSHMKHGSGVAGFLLANGALGDSDALSIRRKLIENDKVEAIIVLPRELFITTDISVTLWVLNQNKQGGSYHGRTLRNREHEILFMDLRQWTENPVKGENKKKVIITPEQIQRAADIYRQWQSEGTDGVHYEEPELYRSVGIDEIADKGWTLIPSKYIEFVDHDLEIDFPQEMAKIQGEMRNLMKQEKDSQAKLIEAFKGIGYGIE
jgi:type I restriction enzyme M protein